MRTTTIARRAAHPAAPSPLTSFPAPSWVVQLATLTRALELGPPPGPTAARERLSAEHNVGMALLAMGAHEQAGVVFDGVLDADPDARDSWAALGVCMDALQQPEAALACQRQVLRLTPAGAPPGGEADAKVTS